jgi:hypothetical protein
MEEYEFHIDAFTPNTIPMARLVEYLRELSLLLGNAKSVHFKRIKSGSVRVVAAVEKEAIPKVRVRVQNARDPSAPDDVRNPYRRIDQMLREDNGVGKLLRGTTNVVLFPGRRGIKSPRMGPFTETASFDGRIVRIGGTDKTAHALLETDGAVIVSAECTRDLARRLAPFLYGAPVRLVGNARWERTEIGEWELKHFTAKDFTELSAEDLATAIGKLRGIQAEWRREADPVELVRKIRGENGGPH